MLIKQFKLKSDYYVNKFKHVLVLLGKIIFIVYIVLLFVGLLGLSRREVYIPSDLATPIVGKFAKINDTQIYYETYLAKSVGTQLKTNNIVMLHGFAASTFTFRYQVEYLTSLGYNVTLVDLPGFGLSQQGVSANSTGMDNQANNIIKLLDTLGIPNFIAVGHSMGGGVAQRIALLQSSRVAGLILIASVDLSGTNGINSAFSFLNNPLLLQIPFGILGSPNLIAQGLKSVVYNPQSINSEWVDGYYKPYTINASTANLISHAFSQSQNLIIFTKNIVAPTLIILGSNDNVITSDVTKNLLQIPNSQSVVTPQTGHLPHEESALEVNQQIGAWLSRVNK